MFILYAFAGGIAVSLAAASLRTFASWLSGE